MTTYRMKVETVNCFNNTISHINELTEKIHEYDENADIPFCGSDIGFKIICGYLEDIGKRALELNDPKLIEACEGLCLFKESEEKQ